jgi:iron complex outermembrane receptor protein
MKSKLILVLIVSVAFFPLHAEEELKLSLDKLFSLKVTSVSGTAMDMKKSPAAIYVITNEDFKKQGHLTIADALKAVPGFHVGKINSSTWSVGSRGFGGQFANKLLVLIDGRSVYTPLFAGVYWEIQDMVLEDIDRIEVIRGPGATLWGANAVNGVINIVTKSSRETTGGHLRLGGSEMEQPYSELRWGDQLGDDLFYRLSMKHTNRRQYDYSNGADGDDDSDSIQFNLKTDWFVTAKDTITTIANVQEFNLSGNCIFRCYKPISF